MKTIFLFLLVLTTSIVSSQVIYVDNQLPTNCVDNYSIGNRNCSGNDGNAYNTLVEAANIAVSGQTVLIRGGVFSEQLNPQNSGSINNPIVFKNYLNEVVEITGISLSPAIMIENKDYITIEGLYIHDVRRWLNALGSDYIVIKNNTFQRAFDTGGSSKTGLFFQTSHYATIQNNTLDDTTQDNLGMVDCDHNLIEGNSFTKGVHALWALKCSNFNVIRNNYFHNELQKIGEIYDCDNVGFGSAEFPKIDSYDDSKYNIVEGNVFAFTPSSGNASPFAGIQYAAQYGIIRNNIFYHQTSPAIGLTIYGREAQFNYGNRIYHNVFYDNKLGAVDISGSTSSGFSDQKFKNNIFYKNTFVQNDFRWNWYAELDNQPVQILTGRINQVQFENNNFFSSTIDELYTIAYGSRTSNSNEPPQSISWWHINRPDFIANSLQANPEFVSAPQLNFQLSTNSPMIDAGTFLAKTTNSGTNSTVIQLDDVKWFSDGSGVTSGDEIQIQGQSEFSQITSINYTTNELTLNTPLTWVANQQISLKYNGTRPDVGAFEFNTDLIFINGFE